MNKRVFGGCHLTRPIVELLTTAGFTITDLDVAEYAVSLQERRRVALVRAFMEEASRFGA